VKVLAFCSQPRQYRDDVFTDVMADQVEQPAQTQASRNVGGRGFGPGFVLIVLGLALGVWGIARLTKAETVDGGKASERQLTKAFTSGGLEPVEPKPPPGVQDPSLPPWLPPDVRPPPPKAKTPKHKFRVNTGATAACKT
jgi:hypothetical protein